MLYWFLRLTHKKLTVHELLTFGNWEFVRRATRGECLAASPSGNYSQHFLVKCKGCGRERFRTTNSLVSGNTRGCIDCFKARRGTQKYTHTVFYRLTTAQVISLAGVSRKKDAVTGAVRTAIDYWLANCPEPVFEKPPKGTPQGVVRLTTEQYQALDKLPATKVSCVYTAVQYYLNNADLSSSQTVPSNWLNRQQQATLDNSDDRQCPQP